LGFEIRQITGSFSESDLEDTERLFADFPTYYSMDEIELIKSFVANGSSFYACAPISEINILWQQFGFDAIGLFDELQNTRIEDIVFTHPIICKFAVT